MQSRLARTSEAKIELNEQNYIDFETIDKPKAKIELNEQNNLVTATMEIKSGLV